jgi:hypothetical protein
MIDDKNEEKILNSIIFVKLSDGTDIVGSLAVITEKYMVVGFPYQITNKNGFVDLEEYCSYCSDRMFVFTIDSFRHVKTASDEICTLFLTEVTLSEHVKFAEYVVNIILPNEQQLNIDTTHQPEITIH